MKHHIKTPFIWLVAVLSVAFAWASTNAQPNSPQNQAPAVTEAPTNTAPATPPVNLPAALNFTPQQADQWRQINREFRVQEVNAVAKVRDARVALNAAMESATPNEETIKQRAKELAEAQSAVTQLQALRQARVLQILTPEQRGKLKEIRQQAQATRRRQQEAGLNGGQQFNRNPNVRMLTPAQRKALRQQQQKSRP